MFLRLGLRGYAQESLMLLALHHWLRNRNFYVQLLRSRKLTTKKNVRNVARKEKYLVMTEVRVIPFVGLSATIAAISSH